MTAMRKKRIAIAAAAAALLLIAGLVKWCGPSTENINRNSATWVWDLKSLLDENGGSADGIVSFMRERDVRYAYVHTTDDMGAGETNEMFRSFIRKAAEAGIEVHALGGERDWVLPGKRGGMSDFLARVAEYNETAEEAEKFAGIHLDVEPYLLDEWEADEALVASRWIEMMEEFVSFARLRGLETGVDLPFWLDRIPAKAGNGDSVTLDQWMMSSVDSVALMSYRDEAEGNNGVLSLVRGEMDHAAETGRTVWIGLNVAKDSDNLLTFYEEGPDSFRGVADRIRREYGDSPAFGGIAVHDLANWMRIES